MYFIALIMLILLTKSNAMDYQYHNYTEMTLILQNLASQYPTKASLVEIGKSLGGKSLWAMALSAYSPDKHILLRPEVKYIGNMHGNEVVGLEVLLYLIEYLLTSNDTQAIRLMNSSRIWIMPSMNPDGLERSTTGDCSSSNGRYTLNNIDLNRNFPDYYGATLESSTRAQETSAVMSWLTNVSFVLSANYHGGAFVINTPFDRYYVSGVSESSDDDVYQLIARAYVNRIMASNTGCSSDQTSNGYVTRGADWYEITGGMQDYGYLNYGTIEMTMEISCCKYPGGNTLENYWNYNRDAMIELLNQAQRGVKGLILNEYSQPITSTEVKIDNRIPTAKVTASGEFWKVLIPGTYTLKVLYRGFEVYNQQITVENTLSPSNLTIIIPTSTYSVYSNITIASTVPSIVTPSSLAASKALQQPVTAVPSLKRDSRVIQKRVDYRQATTPSGSTSNIIKHEHLPSISRQHQVASVGRQHSINDFTLKRAAHLLLNYSRVPQPTNKSKPITMTTARKAMPTRINEFTSQSTRSHSSDSNKRVRKFWWSPKRNEIEIRSDHDMAYKNVTSKVDSLSNLEYRPGGGQVSIRDEPVQWQASPKVNSFANASWAPPAPTINIRKEKVQWNAQPKVDSLSNIDHKPAGGGNIAIRDEKLDLSHVTPRVDCGFVE